MMNYTVQYGDSPARIARRFGVPFYALIQANPHKFATMVAGVRTWQSLVPGEQIRIPVAGMVGDAVQDAANALAATDPCNSDNVALVCLFQAAAGLKPDGKYGKTAANMLKAKVGDSAPARCQHPAWWAPHGQSNCTGTLNLTSLATAARAALEADSNYCHSVRQPGSAVNTAIHNFKAAWNAANPQGKVPIGTSNYEQVVADALSSLTGPGPAPAGCDGAASTTNPANIQVPAPPPTTPPVDIPVVVTPPPAPVVVPPPVPPPAPTPAPTPAPLPPLPPAPGPVSPSVPVASSDLATAAGSAMSALNTDSNYCQSVRRPGSAVNTAVHNFKVAWNASNPQNPVPIGTSNYEPSVASALSNASGGASAPPGCTGGGVTPPPGPHQDNLVAPGDKRGISPGALIAGGIGAAALVGIVAIAATSKKPMVRYRTRKAPKKHRRK